MAATKFAGLTRTAPLDGKILEPVWSQKSSIQQFPAPVMFETEVRVLFEIADLSMTYVEDKNRKRYFIDSDSDIAFKAVKGQFLMAKVTPAGYVHSAFLLIRDTAAYRVATQR